MKQFIIFCLSPSLQLSVQGHDNREIIPGQQQDLLTLMSWGQKPFSWREGRIIFSIVRKSTWARSWFNITSVRFCLPALQAVCLVLNSYFISSQNATASENTRHLKRVHIIENWCSQVLGELHSTRRATKKSCRVPHSSQNDNNVVSMYLVLCREGQSIQPKYKWR